MSLFKHPLLFHLNKSRGGLILIGCVNKEMLVFTFYGNFFSGNNLLAGWALGPIITWVPVKQ